MQTQATHGVGGIEARCWTLGIGKSYIYIYGVLRTEYIYHEILDVKEICVLEIWVLDESISKCLLNPRFLVRFFLPQIYLSSEVLWLQDFDDILDLRFAIKRDNFL